MKYRKKPVVVEAEELRTDNFYAVNSWCGGEVWSTYSEIKIHTLEGDMIAKLGDWVIRGVNGEFYPVKNDIFEKTYEATQ